MNRAQARDIDNQYEITFNDVVGLNDVKKVLQDQVNYLKIPKEYGRASPKGVLLIGNPDKRNFDGITRLITI